MSYGQQKVFEIYLLTVSIVGLAIVSTGFILTPSYDPILYFVLLLVLACVAQLVTTTVPVGKSTSITFEVGNAVSFAAIPLFGPAAAATILATSIFFLWLVKRSDESIWKRSWRQLGFNVGMASFAIYISGFVFIATTNWLDPNFLLQQTLPWLLAAIVFDQVNFWLLVVVLYLQSDVSVGLGTIWRENQWAMPINILITSVGGGLVAYAATNFSWLGIVIFFLPGFFSALAFRLYVHEMKNHMQHLEEIVAERTKSLSVANDKLRIANRDLETYARKKDRLIAVLSHDMRTPLTSIGLYSEMLARQPALPEKNRRRMARVIKLAQLDLADMVTNILDLEGMQTGQHRKINIEHVDLTALTKATIQTVVAQAEAKEIEILVDGFDQPAIHVDTDKEYVKRIIINLLTNASKYTPPGGRVCISLQAKHENVKLIISDTGYGIPREDLNKIFEPYWRVSKHAEQVQGTGLGLSIVKHIVDNLGGTISVTSEEGIGSTFEVELPISVDGQSIEPFAVPINRERPRLLAD